MQPVKKYSNKIESILRCPSCKGKMENTANLYVCKDPSCLAKYPVCKEVPVLINEKNSIFKISDVSIEINTCKSQKVKIVSQLRRFTPKISKNIKARQNYLRIADLLLENCPDSRVLVVGGSVLGQGMEVIRDRPSIELVETDVAWGPRTMLVCDSHDLPFECGSFDGVIIQAVLEHVLDPERCCEEIYRVLRPDGIVYSEVPFMQQVHGGPFDFNRFTHLGHRRLFRQFEEIDSGATCGPGMALAWAYQHFLLSFTDVRRIRSMLSLFSKLTSFFLKYFDSYLIDKPGSLDAASSLYFIGRKSKRMISDRELIESYRGAKK